MVLEVSLLIVFSCLFLFSCYSIVKDFSAEGVRCFKAKSFRVTVVAFGFSLFLVLKVIEGLF